MKRMESAGVKLVRSINVKDDDGDMHHCYSFVCEDNFQGYAPPTLEYIDSMIAAAREVELPEEWITKLEELQTLF